jgi:outer membrane immunogenic protein
MFPRRFVLRAQPRDNDWLMLTGDDQRQVSVFDGSVAMRRYLLAAAIFGAASGAQAADMPDLPILRGAFTDGLSTARVNWQGFYIGGQYGYGASDENFAGSTSNIAAPLVANNVVSEMVSQFNLELGKQTHQSSGFGGFAGYNWQWDDVVVGLEASYLHGGFGGSATASQGPLVGLLSDSNFHTVTATSLASISISDMATFRGRAGYAFGSFLPYMFGGFALGNADITRSVTIQDNFASTFLGAISSCSSGLAFCNTYGSAQLQHNHLIYGYSGGLGIDVNLIGGLFLRAEWEYIRFTSAVDTNVNTVRAGLGYKF